MVNDNFEVEIFFSVNVAHFIAELDLA